MTAAVFFYPKRTNANLFDMFSAECWLISHVVRLLFVVQHYQLSQFCICKQNGVNRHSASL